MSRYPCNGWLKITIDSADLTWARIRLTHKGHEKYTNIEIPISIKDMVREQSDLPASEVFFLHFRDKFYLLVLLYRYGNIFLLKILTQNSPANKFIPSGYE
jgi:hypothetical protein